MSVVATVYAADPTRDTRYKQAVAYPECSAWQTAIELDGLAERTRLDYLRSVSAFIVAYNTEPETWTHLDVNAFLASYPAGSRRKVRAHMSSFFRWLEDEELIDRSPMRKVRRPRANAQKVPDIFDEGEITAMSQIPLLALMLHTGLRKGECRRLQRRHINLDRAELRVVDGKGGKDRVVPLNLTACKAVADMDLLDRLNPQDFMWATKPGGGTVIQRDRPMGEASFHRWWVISLDRVAVEYRNPHVARHTFATRYLRRGGRMHTLTEIMGHASSATTSDYYAHMDLSDARADILLLDATVTV